MQKLTGRQQQVLEGIHKIAGEKGYPPTVREIGVLLGLRSSCTVQRHLEALERKGYLRRDRTKARSIEILQASDRTLVPVPMVSVPIVGTVAAGLPSLPTRTSKTSSRSPATSSRTSSASSCTSRATP